MRPFYARVERSIIGDGLVKGVSRDHLVLPLLASEVHYRRMRSGRVGVHVEGCTRRVYRGVHTGWH